MVPVHHLRLLPHDDKLFVIDEKSPELSSEDAKKFHTAVAKILYLSKRTRVDVLLTTSFLCSRVLKPTEEDWKKLVKLHQYLKGTCDKGLRFVHGPLNIAVYGDAGYLVHPGALSRTGIVVMINGGIVSGVSAKQKEVCKSSTESELVALCTTVSCALALREFLKYQSMETVSSKCIKVLQDNQSVLAMIKNGKPNSARTKHISMRYFFTVQHVRNGKVDIQWVSTKEMLADIMTKPLVNARFYENRDALVIELPSTVCV